MEKTKVENDSLSRMNASGAPCTGVTRKVYEIVDTLTTIARIYGVEWTEENVKSFLDYGAFTIKKDKNVRLPKRDVNIPVGLRRRLVLGDLYDYVHESRIQTKSREYTSEFLKTIAKEANKMETEKKTSNDSITTNTTRPVKIKAYAISGVHEKAKPPFFRFSHETASAEIIAKYAEYFRNLISKNLKGIESEKMDELTEYIVDRVPVGYYGPVINGSDPYKYEDTKAVPLNCDTVYFKLCSSYAELITTLFSENISASIRIRAFHTLVKMQSGIRDEITEAVRKLYADPAADVDLENPLFLLTTTDIFVETAMRKYLSDSERLHCYDTKMLRDIEECAEMSHDATSKAFEVAEAICLNNSMAFWPIVVFLRSECVNFKHCRGLASLDAFRFSNEFDNAQYALDLTFCLFDRMMYFYDKASGGHND